MNNTMHAVVFHKPLHYTLEEVPTPIIQAGEILLKVLACGLCGSDLRTLQYGHRKVIPPFILGHEICGEIVESKISSSSPFEIGQRIAVAPIVYCGKCSYCTERRSNYCENYREIAQAWSGGFAEYLRVPKEAVRNGVLHPIPKSMPSSWATVSEPLAACLNALDAVDFTNIRNAAIFGSGTIGCLMIQLLQNKKVDTRFLIDPNQHRLDVASTINQTTTLNASQNFEESIMQKTQGNGVDLIITATTAPIVQEQALRIAAKGAQILVFSGLPKGKSILSIDYNKIHYNGIKLIGTSIYLPDHHKQALDLIAKKKIQLENIVTLLPLTSFLDGVEQAMNREIIKAVFVP